MSCHRKVNGFRRLSGHRAAQARPVARGYQLPTELGASERARSRSWRLCKRLRGRAGADARTRSRRSVVVPRHDSSSRATVWEVLWRCSPRPCCNSICKRELCAAVYTYGQPRLGDPEFSAAFDAALGSVTFRYVNDFDIVPHLPPARMPAGPMLSVPSSGGDFLRKIANASHDVRESGQGFLTRR